MDVEGENGGRCHQQGSRGLGTDTSKVVYQYTYKQMELSEALILPTSCLDRLPRRQRRPQPSIDSSSATTVASDPDPTWDPLAAMAAEEEERLDTKHHDSPAQEEDKM